MNLVVPALHKVKADVIQTAINSVPGTKRRRSTGIQRDR